MNLFQRLFRVVEPAPSVTAWSGSMSASNLLSKLILSVPLLLIALFAWHQSNFQYDVYVEGNYGLIVYRLSVAAVLMLSIIGSVKSYPKSLVQMVIGYILLVVLYGVTEELITNQGKLLSFVEAAVFSLMMLPIISDKRMLYLFIRVNFVLGTVLIALNTVPVLHWLGLLSLPNEQVLRLGNDRGDYYFLDPSHFGLFGLTESFIYPGSPIDVPRLQGYSLEPLHWSYFVFLTIASGLLLLSARSRPRRSIATALLFGLFAIHLYFVFSMTAFITVAIWASFLELIFILRKYPLLAKRQALYGLIVLILLPGLLIPFALVLVPDVGVLLVADDVLNKGSNWADKIDFLRLGVSLYTRFLPTFGDVPSASHNLILSTYIQYGYVLSAPLVAYMWIFIKRASAGVPFAITAAMSITILAQILIVPLQFYYPSGAMWMLMVVGAAYHSRPGRQVAAMSATGIPAPRVPVQLG
jgi:hypothetical protein